MDQYVNKDEKNKEDIIPVFMLGIKPRRYLNVVNRDVAWKNKTEFSGQNTKSNQKTKKLRPPRFIRGVWTDVENRIIPYENLLTEKKKHIAVKNDNIPRRESKIYGSLCLPRLALTRNDTHVVPGTVEGLALYKSERNAEHNTAYTISRQNNH